VLVPRHPTTLVWLAMVSDKPNHELFTDLYELNMLRAYFARGMSGTAVFDLYVRSLPPQRNYLIAAGLEDVLSYLETLQFSSESLAQLAALGFPPEFLEQLDGFGFTGAVDAVAEGTPIFEGEPLLRIEAPLPQAQLIETYLLNQVHLQTTLASKAARVVDAAEGRSVVDFGARRAHGTDAANKAARAGYLAGFTGTSNVLAAQRYGIPPAGTMAHSYIQAVGDELSAFRSFAAASPETVLLVDTYDTLRGVQNVIALAAELGDDFRVRGIRLDSGDLAALATEARELLDRAGLTEVSVIASGGLDEHDIAALLVEGAPIDAFGVGTDTVTSADAPTLDAVYKLASYEDDGRVKLSPDKATLPHRKQVWRVYEGETAHHDLIGLADEVVDGLPLLLPAMRGGRRTAPSPPLENLRATSAELRGRLPAALRSLEAAATPYPVHTTPALEAARSEAVERAAGFSS
jgi:nicotinate phosphoribosyltransferase